jgi:hypothetical protein
MASGFKDFTFVLDKIPDGSVIKMRVHVKYSWKFKLRFWIGLRLARMSARLLNMRIEVEQVES